MSAKSNYGYVAFKMHFLDAHFELGEKGAI